MPRLHASFSREMSATSLGRDRGSRKHSNYNSMNKWSAKMFICFCLFAVYLFLGLILDGRNEKRASFPLLQFCLWKYATFAIF